MTRGCPRSATTPRPQRSSSRARRPSTRSSFPKTARSQTSALVKGGSLINRGTLKLAAVSTLELENPVGFDNSKGRIETSGKIKINDSGLTEAQQQAPQDIDMGDIRLSGADAMLLSWDKGYTLSTDKDKAKRKARVNFGSVELLDGAHFSQSKNALDSGDSMTIGKGAKMDVAGLSTWQTVTLKAADAQIRLMDEGTLTTVDLKAFFTAEAILKKLTVRTRLAFNVTGIDTAELWDTILKVIQGLYLAQRCPVCSFVSFTRRDSGEFEDAPETDLFPCPVGLAFADDTSLAAFAEYMKSHLSYVPDDDGALFERWADRHPESESGSVDETSAD